MFDVKELPDFTLEGLMMFFLILYTALQFADPIFLVFQFIADIILYLVMIAIAIIAAYVVAMVFYSIGVTTITTIQEAWIDYRQPGFEWVEIEELEKAE